MPYDVCESWPDKALRTICRYGGRPKPQCTDTVRSGQQFTGRESPRAVCSQPMMDEDTRGELLRVFAKASMNRCNEKRPGHAGPRFSCPTTISGPMQMGAARHHDSPRLAAAANRQKKPRPAQVWSGRRLPFVTPVPRSIKGQAPEQRQTSLWRKCEAAPKRRPRTSIRGQVGHDAIRREDTAKMGIGSLSPLRGRPLAKTRYFQGSRNRARKRTCHLRQTADSGPHPKRASYL